jgi:RNA polymerase sigma-70 factor (ECF subfamily)
MDRTGQFLKLFVAHEGELRAFIGALVRERGAREDVFREAAIALRDEFERYDSSRPFGPWARGIAANRLIQLRRRDAHSPIVFSPETIEAVRDAFDRTDAPAGERAAALDECLGRLPERSAEVLSLRYSHAAQTASIASQLHISVVAVHQTLSRLRTQLAECVRRRLTSNPVLRG